jgi:hypothetical protein
MSQIFVNYLFKFFKTEFEKFFNTNKVYKKSSFLMNSTINWFINWFTFSRITRVSENNELSKIRIWNNI